MSTHALLRLAATLIPCSAALACGPRLDEWYTYRYGAARTGAQPYASNLSDPVKVANLRVKWSFPPGGLEAVAGPFVSVYLQQQHFAYRDDKGAIQDAWYAGTWN